MSPTIRSLVIPVSDLDAAKAVYGALLGTPHTDESYYAGYDVDGFEVSLAPGGDAGGPVAYADVEDPDATRAPCSLPTERIVPRQVAAEQPTRCDAGADGPSSAPTGCADNVHYDNPNVRYCIRCTTELAAAGPRWRVRYRRPMDLAAAPTSA